MSLSTVLLCSACLSKNKVIYLSESLFLVYKTLTLTVTSVIQHYCHITSLPACYNIVFGQFKDILIRLAVKMVSWKSAMMMADVVRATVIVVVRGGGGTRPSHLTTTSCSLFQCKHSFSHLHLFISQTTQICC